MSLSHTPRAKDRLQDRIDRAAVYEALAQAETDTRVAEVYRRLAAVESAHAEFRSRRRGRDAGPARPSAQARLLAFLGRTVGASLVLPMLTRKAVKADAETAGTEEASAVAMDRAEGANAGSGAASGDDDRAHARKVQAAAAEVGGLPGQTLAQLEGRRRGGGGNALRAAVLGANDGLVSNLSLVMGVAGAAANGRIILLTGLAGLVAGACSMAMGEWLSVNSAREMTQRQIAAEARELEAAPDLEKQELILIYQAKGLDEGAARALAERLFQSREAALDTLAREALGVDPDELGGSPWAAAASSFALFAIGAIFPVAPFIFASGLTAVVASLALSGVALAGIGGVTSAFTGRDLAFSAGRQLAIGWAAAGLTFAVGRLIGVSVS